jgi:hypothetical protein
MENFLTENDVIAINFNGVEVIGKFVSTYKDDNSKYFLILRDAVLIVTQKTDKGLVHSMADLSENGNFFNELLISWNSVSFIRKVSALGDLFKTYVQATSAISIPGLHILKK